MEKDIAEAILKASKRLKSEISSLNGDIRIHHRVIREHNEGIELIQKDIREKEIYLVILREKLSKIDMGEMLKIMNEAI